ncbi:hypothetical protein O3Q51_09685 [Cryomorphaceae bacterium 1068]|nr:hypothetical protein [Cryomorphaceae bacterium 1068]
MKKLFGLILGLAIVQISLAQAPQKMSYQSVIRDASNELVTETAVGIQISILQGSPAGTAVFVETHAPTTNTNGLASLEIGGGIPINGTLDGVDWGNGPYYITSETDPSGGTNYTLSGTTELLSVPYALYAANAGGDGSWTISADTLSTDKWVGIGTDSPNSALHVKADDEEVSLKVETTGLTPFGSGPGSPKPYPASIDIKHENTEYKLSLESNGSLTISDVTSEDPDITIFNRRVGIGGPTSSLAKLNVDGALRVRNTIRAFDGEGIKFRTDDGVTRITMADNGRIGIGEEAPEGLLHLKAPAGVLPTIFMEGGSEDIAYQPGSALQFGTWDGTDFDETLRISGNGSLGVGTSDPLTKLHVDGDARFDVGTGNVRITGPASGGAQNSALSYPLYVTGAAQGIAIRLDETEAEEGESNYMYFRDNGGTRGSIGAQTLDDVTSSFRFEWYVSMNTLNTAWAVAEGIACGPQLDLGEVAVMAAAGATAVAEWAEWTNYMQTSAGVVFQSGSADYAEWLERESGVQDLAPGTVVGVAGGKVSLNTADAREVMVVSMAPLVLGNMPEEGKEHLFEKIAFMGQVPVKVIGKVLEGDFILATGLNDGMAIAKSRDQMTLDDYDNVVGVAWSSSIRETGVSLINTAVGLSTNDLVASLKAQQEEIAALKASVSKIERYISQQDPSFEMSTSIVGEPNNVRTDWSVSTAPRKMVKESSQKIDFLEIEKVVLNNQDFLLEILDQARAICIDRGMDVNDPLIAKHFQADYFMECLRNSNAPYVAQEKIVAPEE